MFFSMVINIKKKTDFYFLKLIMEELSINTIKSVRMFFNQIHEGI